MSKRHRHRVSIPAEVPKGKTLLHTSAYFNGIISKYKDHKLEIKPKNTSIVKVVLEEKKNILNQRREEGILKQEDSLDEIVNDDKTKKTINKLTFKNDIYKRNSPKKEILPFMKNKSNLNLMKSSLQTIILNKKNSQMSLMNGNRDSYRSIAKNEKGGKVENPNLEQLGLTTNVVLERNASVESFLPKLDSTRYTNKNTNINSLNKLVTTINSTELKRDVSKIFYNMAKSYSVGKKNLTPEVLENNINQEYTDTLRNTLMFKSTKQILRTVVI